MARIAGVELNNNKRIDIGLTAIFGVGRQKAREILYLAQVDPSKRAKDLVVEEITKLQKKVEESIVEGDLRQSIRQERNYCLWCRPIPPGREPVYPTLSRRRSPRRLP